MTLGPCPNCGEAATDIRKAVRPRLPLGENFRVTCRACGARLAPRWQLWTGLVVLAILFVTAAYPLGEWVGGLGSRWVAGSGVDPYWAFIAVALLVAVGCLLAGLLLGLALELVSWKLGWWRVVPTDELATG